MSADFRDPADIDLPTPDQLRELRLIAGLSVAEAAEAMDVHRDTIWHWESGAHSPQLADVRELVELYRDRLDGQTQFQFGPYRS